MSYQLENGIERLGTNCFKWDINPEGVLPMWVADMDFPCAPGIIDAMKERLDHPAFGYAMHPNAHDKQAVCDYYARNHGVSVTPDDLLFTPGVVDSLLLAVHALAGAGDKVLIQTPVYGPFYGVIERAGRTLVENPMIETESGKWVMDLDDLDKKLEGCKLMLLCSPHNPFGRIWERETLQAVLDLCKKHNVYLVSDEIHCDFALDDNVHTSVLTLDGADKGVAAAVSATKSYNIAALNHSTILAPDADMRKLLSDKAGEIGMSGGNLFGVIATTAAYETGAEWLKEAKSIISANRDLAIQVLTEAGCKVYPIQGTYLLPVDMRAFGKTCDELYDALMAGKVRLNRGTDFGARGEGFMRLNLATPTHLMEEGLRRIVEVLKTL